MPDRRPTRSSSSCSSTWRISHRRRGGSKAGAAALLIVGFPLALTDIGAQTTVAFQVGDSVRLEADVYGTGDRGVVVIGHGGYSSRTSWQTEARALANAGFRALVFDTRGAIALRAGKETECLYDASCMAVDVLAAVRYLRRAGARTIAVVGGSAGGGAAAQASVDAAADEIDRLVLLAPMTISNPHQMKGRKFFATSRADLGSDDKPRLPEIRELYERTPGPKEFLLLDGTAHGQRIFGTAEGARLRREMLRFLSEK